MQVLKLISTTTLILVLAAVMQPAPVSAVEVVSYSSDLDVSLVADFLWRFVRDVQYRGGAMYVLSRSGIQVYDGGADFRSPRLVAQVPLESECWDLDFDGDTAVLYADIDRLKLLDASDTENIHEILTIDVSDTVFGHALLDNFAYVACGFSGVRVIDFSDPSELRQVAMLNEGIHVTEVTVQDEYLYVVDDFNGLLVYGIENPADPSFLDEFLIEYPVTDIAFSEDRVFLAGSGSGVVSYKLERPLRLTTPSTFHTISRSAKVSIKYDHILVSDALGRIYVFGGNTSKPQNVFEDSDLTGYFDLASKNNRVYAIFVTKFGNLEILSADAGVEPDLVWRYPGADLTTSAALIGDLVVVAGKSEDLTVWRIKEDGTQEEVSAIGVSASQALVVALDSLLVVAENSFDDDDNWIRLFNLLQPCPVLNVKRDLEVWSRVTGMEVEYNDSGAIDLTAFGPTGTTLYTLEPAGEDPEDRYAVLARSFVESKSGQTAVERHRGYLYACFLKSFGKIYDIAGMGIFGQFPEVGTFAVAGAKCIEIVDSLCYFGGDFGLQIHRMDGYLVGETIMQVHPEFYVNDMEFDWRDSLMFVALGRGGVAVYDVADIAAPKLLIRMDTPGYAQAVDVSHGRFAVMDRYSVKIFDYSFFGKEPILPSRFDLAQNYPNPFNAATKIEFSIPGDRDGMYHVELEIINLLGRTVRTLVDAWLPAGFYKYGWDGTDESGREVSSGVYFYRLSCGGTSESKKMVLLR